MGFFKDLRTIERQAKELGDRSDPGAQLAAMGDKLRVLNASMAQQAAAATAGPGDAVAGSVQVVSVAPTSGSMNGDPIVAVSVLVLSPGRPPIPATTTIAVPAAQLARLRVGAAVPAHLSHADPTAFAFDWTRPSP